MDPMGLTLVKHGPISEQITKHLWESNSGILMGRLVDLIDPWMVDFYGKLDGGFKYSIFYGWWNTPWKLMIGDGWKFTDTWMVDFLWLLLGSF